jgi:hypothetical protein
MTMEEDVPSTGNRILRNSQFLSLLAFSFIIQDFDRAANMTTSRFFSDLYHCGQIPTHNIVGYKSLNYTNTLLSPLILHKIRIAF